MSAPQRIHELLDLAWDEAWSSGEIKIRRNSVQFENAEGYHHIGYPDRDKNYPDYVGPRTDRFFRPKQGPWKEVKADG